MARSGMEPHHEHRRADDLTQRENNPPGHPPNPRGPLVVHRQKLSRVPQPELGWREPQELRLCSLHSISKRTTCVFSGRSRKLGEQVTWHKK